MTLPAFAIAVASTLILAPARAAPADPDRPAPDASQAAPSFVWTAAYAGVDVTPAWEPVDSAWPASRSARPEGGDAATFDRSVAGAEADDFYADVDGARNAAAAGATRNPIRVRIAASFLVAEANRPDAASGPVRPARHVFGGGIAADSADGGARPAPFGVGQTLTPDNAGPVRSSPEWRLAWLGLDHRF